MIPVQFHFGDRVIIDGGDLVAVVIGIGIYPHGTEFKVSWWNAGILYDAWIADWRLALHASQPSGTVS